MNEPIKKRLIGAVVIAAVGGLALSFVLHDSHPTYPEGARVAYQGAASTTSPSASTQGSSNDDANTHLLILPKKHRDFQTVAMGSSEHPLLSTHPESSNQGTCHYKPETHSTDCDEPASSSVKQDLAPAQTDPQSEELKNLVSLSKPTNSPVLPKAAADEGVSANAPSETAQPQLTPKPATEKGSSKAEPSQVSPPSVKKQENLTAKNADHYLLRLATFKVKSNATHLTQRLKTQGLPAHSTLAHAAGTTYYRVVIGPANQGLVNKWKKDLALTEHLQGCVVKK